MWEIYGYLPSADLHVCMAPGNLPFVVNEPDEIQGEILNYSGISEFLSAGCALFGLDAKKLLKQASRDEMEEFMGIMSSSDPP